MKSFSDNIVDQEKIGYARPKIIMNLVIVNLFLNIVIAILLYYTLAQPVYLELQQPEQPKVETPA